MPEKKSADVKEALKLVAVIVIVVGIVFGINIGLQMAMGTSTPVVVVISESMEPTLYRGDVCIVQRVSPDQYVPGNHTTRIGDIIVFDATGIVPGSDPVIHRIVGRQYNNVTDHYSFATQGDNVRTNPFPDPGWVEDTNVYGKVIFTIPWVGNIFLFLREGGIWILVIALVAIIVYVFVSETSKIDKKVKEQVKPDADKAASHVMKQEA